MGLKFSEPDRAGCMVALSLCRLLPKIASTFPPTMRMKSFAVTIAINSLAVIGFVPSSVRLSIPRFHVSLQRRGIVLPVSKKEKAGRAKAAAVEQRLQNKARRELEQSLREQQTEATNVRGGKRTKAITKRVRNLLYTAQREGICDIGDEAKVLAASVYVAIGRHSDALFLLSDISNIDSLVEEDPTIPIIGLEANAGLGNWDTAADYSEMLIDGLQMRFDLDTPDNLLADSEKVISLVIQSFCKAGRNIDAAAELLCSQKKSQRACDITPVEYNSILSNFLRSRQPEKARDFYDKMKCEAVGDGETCRIALNIAAELADMELAVRAFKLIKAKSDRTPEDLVIAITAFRHLGTSNSNYNEYLDFVQKLVEDFGAKGTEVTLHRDSNMPSRVFSILLARPEADGWLRIVDSSKLIKTQSLPWPEWLSEEARMTIFPALEQLPDRFNDTVSVFGSLRLDPNAVHSFHLQASSDFWSAAFRIAIDLELDLAYTILQSRVALSNDIDTLLSRGKCIMSMYSQKLISSQEAEKEVNHTESIALQAANSTTAVLVTMECVVARMCLREPELRHPGTESSIKYMCNCLSSFFDVDHVADSKLGPSRLEAFEVMQMCFSSLYRVYYLVGSREIYQLMFPLGIPEQGLEVLDTPVVGGFLRGEIFVEPPRKGYTMLNAVIESALACDKLSGNDVCIENFILNYHASVRALWGSYTGLTEYLVDGFVSESKSESVETTHIDKVKHDLWGARCQKLLLDQMEQDRYCDDLLQQIDGRIYRMWGCISALFITPIFKGEELRSYEIIRTRVAKEIVDSLFKVGLDGMEESENAVLMSQLSKLPERECMRWSYAAGKIYSGCFLNLHIALESTKAQEINALHAISEALLDQPMVKDLDREVLLDLIMQLGEDALAEWQRMENKWNSPTPEPVKDWYELLLRNLQTPDS